MAKKRKSSRPTVEALNIETGVHGRYLFRPAASGGKALLVGFHGYGETAEDHLDALLELPGLSAWNVAAVQALHPFYKNRTGEIAASWMTRLDRGLAIADNVRYVAAVLRQIKAERKIGNPLVLLGFSQGTAMAYRTVVGAGHRTHGLVALGGDMPPEIAHEPPARFPRVLIARGRDDEWYDAAKMERDIELLEAIGVEAETCVFDGGHEWTGEFYQAAGRFVKGFLA